MASNNKDTPQKKKDVFITYSEDTSRNFTSHLSAEMKRLGIEVEDNNINNICLDGISYTLVREPVDETDLLVAVFSKKISAKLCFEVTQCMKNRKIVVPIFYGVDPSDVRNQTGIYEEIFVKFEEIFGKIMVQEWRNALFIATNYAGWNCNVKRSDFQLVEEIAMDVLQILNRVQVSDIDYKIAKYEELGKLQYKSNIEELEMERSLRLLRLSPDLLSYI